MKASEGVIRFRGYKVLKAEFELNIDYDWNGEPEDVVFNAESSKYVSEDGNDMLVQLGLNIFEDEEQNYPFKMKVELIGEFELRNVDIENEKDIKKYYANALAILYPYARAIVSNYTANANIEPLILPTVNIWKMINN